MASLQRHESNALQKALSKEPHTRFPSCEDFINTLVKANSFLTSFLDGISLRSNAKIKQLVLEKASICKYLHHKLKETDMLDSKLSLKEFDSRIKNAGTSASNGNYEQAILLYDKAIRFGEKRIEQLAGGKPRADKLKSRCNHLLGTLIENKINSSQLYEYYNKKKVADQLHSEHSYKASIEEYEEAINLAKNILK